MTGIEELKTAYKTMADECGFLISDVIYDKCVDAESWVLVFKYFEVGIGMSFIYAFIVDDDPLFDDLGFTGDPCSYFSVYCYRIIADFIKVMQLNRLDKDVMNEFIEYLDKNKQ